MAQNLGQVPIGNLVTITLTFTTPAGVATDPAAVNAKASSGATSTITTFSYAGATITKVSTGIYTFQVNCNEPGTWTARGYAPPGSGQASQDFNWEVLPSPLYP